MNKFFWAVCLFGSIQAEIFQIHKIEECQDHLQSDMILIFDLDNTVFEPVQTLGSDQWFDHEFSEFVNQGYSADEALQVTKAEWIAIQNKTKVKLVEPMTASIIHTLQQKGWKVMGLTSRGLYLSTRTIEQLHSVGIDFSATAPSDQKFLFDRERGLCYQNGILFSAGTSKGSLLFRFFQETDVHPKQVLFVDDKLHQLEDVRKACQEHLVPMVGLRYGYLDQKVAAFDPKIAAIQMTAFSALMSDEEASLRYSNDNKNQKNAIVGSKRMAPSDPAMSR